MPGMMPTDEMLRKWSKLVPKDKFKENFSFSMKVIRKDDRDVIRVEIVGPTKDSEFATLRSAFTAMIARMLDQVLTMISAWWGPELAKPFPIDKRIVNEAGAILGVAIPSPLPKPPTTEKKDSR